MTALHPDWTGKESPFWDFTEAIAYRNPVDVATLATTDEITAADVAQVTEYAVIYHGIRWAPGNETGTELELVAIGTLNDGRWFSVVAWNDYTGWGCGDDSHVHVAATRDAIWSNGLDNESRALLSAVSA